ncbi:MAG: radical SAM protein [Deltaproteobacteria bacterium]
MRKLKIGIIDFITKSPNHSLWARVMHANFMGIMPQVVAKWCEDAGHDVDYFIYTGLEDLAKDAPKDVDMVFINAFTQSATHAYALSCKYRKEGVITVLGGPHARCYPEDAVKYFDYVLGLTDEELILDVLKDCSQYMHEGLHLSAKSQPKNLPGVRERWKYISKAHEKTTFLFRVVPMIGSLGCPYTCSFCIDASEPYQPLDFDMLKEDLRFVLTKIKRPLVSWYDPNFGVRFDDYMNAIEEAVPLNSIDFIAESSLSLLSEPHLKRLNQNSFQALLPGIESWFDMGNKSKTGAKQGMEKVKIVSEHINLILSYIPYVQTNFVVGLDSDNGAESFELTKKFVDMAPAAFPAYPLITAFGRAAPLNLEYQSEDRVLPFPFHFLNNNHASNVKPKNYSWPEFYDLLIDLAQYSYSLRSIYNRFRATRTRVPRWMNVMRAISTEGSGRIKFYRKIRQFLQEDTKFRDFFEGETTEIPDFYVDMIKKDLGPLWEYLPEGAIYHDQNAYLKSEMEKKQKKVQTA